MTSTTSEGPALAGPARSNFDELLDDLIAESASLRRILAGIGDAGWDTPTPAEGWAVRDQIGHLAYFDETARTALVDPDRFVADAAGLAARGADFADAVARDHRRRSGDELLAWWDRARAALVISYRGADPRGRLPWYGPPMSVMSAATARLMETWAHGVDVADALGVELEDSPRLRHVAHLGVRTLGFSFSHHGLALPTHPVRVELTSSGGYTWSFGPDEADDVVRGAALEFCTVVTQRRNVADTALEVVGPVARAWMDTAQIFAGRPTLPPPAGTRTRPTHRARLDREARRDRNAPLTPPRPTAPTFDVTSLHHRRAAHRWERTAVADLVERLTWSFPDRLALVGAEGAYADPAFARVTYREADETANRIAHALAARGLEQGDVVAMLCENSVEALLVKLGVAKAGLVVAPLNPALATDVVTDILRRIEPALVVVDAEVWPGHAATLAGAGVAAGVTIEIGGGAVAGSISWAELIADQPSTEPDVEIHGDDIWELLFTSGTTSSPKAVMLSHANGTLAGYGSALSVTRGLRFEDDLVLCSFLPLVYHIGDHAFALATFAAGGTLVVGRRPDPHRIAAAVAAEGATALWAGSPQLLRGVAEVLDHEPDRYDARRLRVIVYGWAALHPDTLDALQRACHPDLLVYEIFGQTESIASHRFWPARWEETYRRTAPTQNYVGVPSSLLASMVMDAEGRSLAGSPGQAGEAVYRSPAVMAGYYKDEAATRDAFRYGWFHSGDSCVYDADGLRIMVDRFKDIIKSGGENVSSLRVESVLVQHPAVARAAVIGLPHDRWGEAVTAVVVAKEGYDVVADDVIAFCRRALAGFETPKQVVVVEGLPETVGGKVLKYRLRAGLADLYTSTAGPP
jgi:uncharacterized protein (TIGR03084 family)